VAWYLTDESSEFTERVLERVAREEATVPNVWPLEVTNALLKAERLGRTTEAQTVHFIESLADLLIRVDPGDTTTVFSSIPPLARAHGLTSYDASYLDLAMRLGLPLATLDAGLIRAANAAGVALVT
jgi:predicted nucleic acid-binding protein